MLDSLSMKDRSLFGELKIYIAIHFTGLPQYYVDTSLHFYVNVPYPTTVELYFDTFRAHTELHVQAQKTFIKQKMINHKVHYRPIYKFFTQ